MTTTCISVREDVLEAMRRLAELRRQRRGGVGRASVSETLSDLALAELERVGAAAKRKRGRADA